MKVLVVNAGSTSLKRHLVQDGASEAVDGFPTVEAVGHRIVHGGPRRRHPVVVDDGIEDEIAAAAQLAPLHATPALRAIDAAREALPDVPHVAVFDTAFHATLPEAAHTYPVPPRWREQWGIRRYGFHGLAVESVAEQVRAARLVVCHLGGGCSVTAVRDGRSVDTTMGFTPLDGVPMATRSGAVDPGALLYLLRTRRLDIGQLEHDLEHASGLTGLGGSGDARDLDPDGLAVAVFVHRVAGAIGMMAAALGGADVIACSGGIGEHAGAIRDRIAARVAFLGAAVRVVPAREELVIARHVETVLRSSP